MTKFPVLNISQFPAGRTDEFYANDFVSHISSYHKTINKPHKHDFYLIALFSQGQGRHEIDFNAYTIKRGSVFLLNPGQTHHWEFSRDTDGYVFFHTRAFYDLTFPHKSIHDFPFYHSFQNNPCLYLDENQLSQLMPLFDAILTEYRTDRPLKFHKIGSLLDLIYIEITRNYIATHQQKNNRASHLFVEKLQQLVKLIDAHYLKEKSPACYAGKMHLSTKHLNRIVKSVLGKTTSQLITERVILEAKRMLVHADTTVSEVAELLGYHDHSYFSRFFKKECGITPGEFAAKYR